MDSTASGKANILVLSIYRDLAEAFVETLGGEGATEADVAGMAVRFNIVAGDPIQYPSWDEQVSSADYILMIVRFLDVHSLEKIKGIYRYLPNELTVPLGVFLLRDKGEIDFKISCPACGQKLWLRDTDVGKRGRCPNCKKPFIIQSQLDYLKSQLMLPEEVIIKYAMRDDADSCKTSLQTLLESSPHGIKPVQADTKMDAAKNVTMRIQINE